MTDSNPDGAGVSERCIERIDARGREHRVDRVVVEEPLELRVAGEPLVTTMRTPGDDEELALGWLLSEGLISERSDVRVRVRSSDDARSSAVDITPVTGNLVDANVARLRRGATSNSSCGVCGRRGIDDLLARCVRVRDDARWPAQLVALLPDRLKENQRLFSTTGGLHAAAAVKLDGSFMCVREDVGRHNAVDKLVGWLLGEQLIPALASALVVSGRASFEIVQKAIAAGFGLVVCVSAPSSLAVDIATKANVTLVAFARAGGFNVYSAAERIVSG